MYIGKGLHYYDKAKIGHFKIEAYDIKVGDHLLVTGPTTGAKEFDLSELMVDDILRETAGKGAECTIPVDFKIRTSDKLYKLMDIE